MTWKTLTDLLCTEYRRIGKMHVVSFGFANAQVTDPEEVRAIELQLSEKVDAIVRDFARTRRWPALDEKERFFLRERMRFAYEYARISEISVSRPLIIAGRAQVCNEQRRLLEWLLIDVWRNSGVVNWLEPLILMCRPGAEVSVGKHFELTE